MPNLSKAHVYIAPEARADLFSIFEYLLRNEGIELAEKTILELETSILSLHTLPERGKYPPELLSEGITLFREFQKYPWRIFYRVLDNEIWILAVLDGRRNIASLLSQRLLQQ